MKKRAFLGLLVIGLFLTIITTGRNSLALAANTHVTNVPSVSGETYEGYETDGNGGAIYNEIASTILNSTFIGNKTIGTSNNNRGGAIAINASLSDATTITDSTFIGNISAWNGGAVSQMRSSGSLTVTDSIFTSNQSLYEGGALFLGSNATIIGNTESISGSTFTENKTLSTTYSDQYNTNDDGGGGAIFVGSVAKVTIDNTEFTSNESGTVGGAVAVRSDSKNNGGNSLAITNSTFTSNTATLDGGAVKTFIDTTISNSEFTGNYAGRNGGAIDVDANNPDASYTKATVTITDSVFTNNTAAGLGGAIHNTGTVNINGSATFSGNKSNYVDNENYEANDIYNEGTVNLNAGADKTISLTGGISGDNSNKGTLGVNTTSSYTGVVDISGDLNNQNVTVSYGELALSNGAADGSNLAGSAITVGANATINSTDNIINDYTSYITLQNDASIKGDINYVLGTADMYAAEGGATVKYLLGTVIDDEFGKSDRTIQVVSDGATVDINSATFTTDHGLTFQSSGAADGKMIVKGVSGGINTAVDNTTESGSQQTVHYTITENEEFANVSDTDRTIQNADFTVDGEGRKITAATDAKGFIIASDSKFTSNNTEYDGFDNDNSGAIKNYGTTYINNSKFNSSNSLAIDNYGVVVSDPSVYEAGSMNHKGATYTATDDIFRNIDRAGEDGGAIYNEAASGSDPAGTVTLNNITAYNNTAAKGGVLYNAGTATINGGTFGIDNITDPLNPTAAGNSATAGGIIYNAGSLTINGGTFANSSATGNGGAIYSAANLTINGTTAQGAVTFSNNTAAAGNDIYMQGVDGSNVNLYLNAIDNTNTVTLGSGVAGQYYNIYVNNDGVSVGKVIASGALSGVDTLTLTAGSMDAAGITADTLNVTAGTLTSSADITVNQGTNAGTIDGAGKFIVGNGDETSTTYTNNGLIKNANIEVKANDILTTKGSDSTTASSATYGIIGAVNNAGTLNVISDNIIGNISGNGKLATADGVAIKSGTTVSQGTLDVTGTLTNAGTLTVATALTNGGSGVIDGEGDINLNGGESAEAMMSTNAVTINSTGNLSIGGFVNNTGSITAYDISIASSKMLSTAADAITDSHDATISNAGTLKLTGGTALDTTVTGANAVTGAGKIVIDGFVNQTASLASSSTDANAISINSSKGLIINANNLDAKTENSGTLVLNGGKLDYAVTGAGTTSITGSVINASTIVGNDISIASGASLSTDADKVTDKNGTIENAGTLTLTGGTDTSPVTGGNAVSGSGKIVIDGFVDQTASLASSSSDANAISVIATSGLRIDADNIGAALKNDGMLNLNGDGTLLKAITGAGSTEITGKVLNSASITQTDSTAGIIISSGSLTTAANTISAIISNEVTNGLILTSGTNANTISSTGSTQIKSTGTVTNTGDIQQDVNVTTGTFNNTTGSVTGTTTVSEGAAAQQSGSGSLGAVSNSGTFTASAGSVGAITNNDTATISGASTGAITNNDTLSISSGSVASVSNAVAASSTTQTGGTVTGDVANAGTYTLSAGTIGGNVTNSKTFNYNGGTITGTYTQTEGDLNIANNATFTLGSGSALAGNVTLGAVSPSSIGTLIINNAADNTFKITTNNASVLDIQNGTLTMSAGSSLADTALVTIGTASGTTGALNVSNGTATLGSDDTWNAKGTVNVNGGTLNLAGAAQNGTFTQTSGTTNITAAQTLGTGTNISGGTLNVNENLTVNAGTIAATSTTIAANKVLDIVGGSVTLNGVTTSDATGSETGSIDAEAGALTIQGTTTLGNAADVIKKEAVVTVGSTDTLKVAGATTTLNSDVTTPASADTWSGAIEMSSGNITLDSMTVSTGATQKYNQTNGTLTLDGSSLTLNAGSKITGGTVVIDPSELIFNNGEDNSAKILMTVDDGSSLTIEGLDSTHITTLTLLTDTDIQYGTVTVGTGALANVLNINNNSNIAADVAMIVNTNAIANLAGTSTLTINSGDTWNGTVNQTNGTLTVLDNVVKNATIAKLTSNGGNLVIGNGDTTADVLTLNNSLDSIAAGTTVTIDTDGTLAQIAGTVTLDSSDTWHGAISNGGGTLNITGRTDTLDGTVQKYTQTSGTLNLTNSTMNIANAASSITGGNVNLASASTLTVNNGLDSNAAQVVTTDTTTNNLTVGGTSALKLINNSAINKQAVVTVGTGSSLEVNGTASSGVNLNGGSTGADSWVGDVKVTGGVLNISDNLTKTGTLTQTSGNGTTNIINTFATAAGDNVTSGTLNIGDGTTTTALNVTGGTITSGDGKATVNILSGATMTISGGSVTLDGGTSAAMDKVNWAGNVVLNAGGSLTLAHIVDQSRGSVYNKTGLLTANGGNLTIDNTTVLLGNGDLIADAVNLTLTGDIYVGKDNGGGSYDSATVYIGRDDTGWTNGTVHLVNNGQLTLNGITTDANKSVDAQSGTLILLDNKTGSGSGNTFANSNDKILYAVTTTVNSPLNVNAGLVQLDNNNDTLTSGKITLNGGELDLTGISTANNQLDAQTGLLKIEGDATTTLNNTTGDSIAKAVVVNIVSGSTLKINSDTASVVLNSDVTSPVSADTWDGGIELNKGQLTLDSRNDTTTATKTYVQDGGSLTLLDSGLKLATGASSIIGGNVALTGTTTSSAGSQLTFDNGLTTNAAVITSDANTNNALTVGGTNGATLTLNSGSNINAETGVTVTSNGILNATGTSIKGGGSKGITNDGIFNLTNEGATAGTIARAINNAAGNGTTGTVNLTGTTTSTAAGTIDQAYIVVGDGSGAASSNKSQFTMGANITANTLLTVNRDGKIINANKNIIAEQINVVAGGSIVGDGSTEGNLTVNNGGTNAGTISQNNVTLNKGTPTANNFNNIGSLTANGTFTNHAVVTDTASTGTLNIKAGGSSDGVITQKNITVAGDFVNDANMTATTSLSNSGNIDNDAKITAKSLTNTGTITTTDGTGDLEVGTNGGSSTGTISQRDITLQGGTFDNTATMTSSRTFTNHAVVTDTASTGTLNIKDGSSDASITQKVVNVSGAFQNDAALNGTDHITVNAGGSITNTSAITTPTLNNSGAVTNSTSTSSIVANYINNYAGASITNSGTVTSYVNIINSGTITNNAGASVGTVTLTNNAAAVVTNNGSLSASALNNYGTVTNNKTVLADTITTYAGSQTTNNDSMTAYASVTNGGTFTNATGATLGTATLTNNAASIFYNDGDVTVNGTLTNSGTFTNDDNGVVVANAVTNNAAAIMTNDGSISAPTVTNNGTLTNNKTVLADNIVTGVGSQTTNNDSMTAYNSITNSGTITNSSTGTIGTVTLTNNAYAIVTNNGTLSASALNNYGTVTNNKTVLADTITTYAGSQTTNNDSMTAYASVTNGGTFTNATGASLGTATLNNNAASIFYNDGDVTVNGTLTNSGTFTNDDNGVVVANAVTNNAAAIMTNDGSISAPTVTNNGTLTNNNSVLADNMSTGAGSQTTNNDTITAYNSVTNGGTFTNNSTGTVSTTDFTNSPGALLTNDGIVNSAGNFLNNSTVNNSGEGKGTLNVNNGTSNGPITQGNVNIAAGNTAFNNNNSLTVEDTLNNAGNLNNIADISVQNSTDDAEFVNTGVVTSTERTDASQSAITANILTNTGGVMNLENTDLTVTDQNANILGTINTTGNATDDETNISISGTTPNFAGNLNVGSATDVSTLNLLAGNVTDNAVVNIASGNVMNVNGANASLVLNDNGDVFAGDLNLKNGDVEMKNITVTAGNTSTTAGGTKPYYTQTGGELTLTNSTLTMANSALIEGGDMILDPDAVYNSESNSFTVDNLTNAGLVNGINGGYENYAVNNNLSAGDGVSDKQGDFTIDLYARSNSNKKYDSYGSDTATITATNGTDGILNVSDWKLNGDIYGYDAPIDRRITVSHLFNGTVDPLTEITFAATKKEVLTPIGWYRLNSKGGGNYSFDLTRYNPAVFRGQITTLAQYQNQLMIDDMIFNHTMLDQGFKGNDIVTANPNRFASANDIYAPYQYSRKNGGVWMKMYGTFEHLNMNHGLNVGNNAYGTIIGVDLGLKELSHGWQFMPTVYLGYNGAHQYWRGNGAYQNGGQLGFLGTWYKKDFMIGALVYGGVYGNEMTTPRGHDDTFNYFAGGSIKGAYNWKFLKNWALQPNLLVAYNFFGQENWHTDFGQMGMMSGMLHGINVAPGLNLIWEKETFSLYATIQYMYNVNQSLGGRAGNVYLPHVHMDRGYLQYGLGINKRFTNRFSGYFQFVIRNVGRTGIGLQMGFNWVLGKGSKSVKPSERSKINPEMVPTKVDLNSK